VQGPDRQPQPVITEEQKQLYLEEGREQVLSNFEAQSTDEQVQLLGRMLARMGTLSQETASQITAQVIENSRAHSDAGQENEDMEEPGERQQQQQQQEPLNNNNDDGF